MELSGRVALVTGAGRRLGQAIAVALGRRGMRVAVHHHGSERGAAETVDAIVQAGGQGTAFRRDLTEPEGPEALIAQVVRTLGTVDVLVNSAAVMLRTPVGETTPAQWDEMFALNLRAPFFLCQAVAPVMRERGGAIVNIADLAAFETWPAYVPHSITKAGVVQMTRGLSRVLAPTIRVNAVAPGVVLLPEGWEEATAGRLARTTPLERLGAPDDVVGAVLYLLEADYVTGETVIVDGGRHIRR